MNYYKNIYKGFVASFKKVFENRALPQGEEGENGANADEKQKGSYQVSCEGLPAGNARLLDVLQEATGYNRVYLARLMRLQDKRV